MKKKNADQVSSAVEEMYRYNMEKTYGPRNQCTCPDCGAILKVMTTLELSDWKQYYLEFVKHVI